MTILFKDLLNIRNKNHCTIGHRVSIKFIINGMHKLTFHLGACFFLRGSVRSYNDDMHILDTFPKLSSSCTLD